MNTPAVGPGCIQLSLDKGPCTQGSEDERITEAITATRVFFERLTVGTRLRDYEIGGASIGKLIAKLEEHGMTALGENGDVTPDVSRAVYQAAV
jgi:NADP-dependent alcohol dehydrogenase